MFKYVFLIELTIKFSTALCVVKLNAFIVYYYQKNRLDKFVFVLKLFMVSIGT